MSWDAIGAIGELLGAVAVVVTLIFLIFQIRQNAKAIEAATSMTLQDQGTAWIYQVIRDPDMAKLYREGLTDSLESPDDRMRFNLLMQALFNFWSVAYSNNAPFPSSEIARVLSTPGGRRYWKKAQEGNLHLPEFASFVNEIKTDIDK